LGRDSFLFAWRNHDASWRRLVDTELWSTARKRIIMDSDILVRDRPEALLDWIDNSDRPMLLGQAPAPSQAAPSLRGPGRPFIQDAFKKNLEKLSQSLGLPNWFLDGTSSGFYGCSRELGLDRVERLLRNCLGLGIAMGDWGSEQCTVI